MIRSMMQVYIKDSQKALATYQKAFDVKPTEIHLHEDGKILHAEINLYGQVIALSEAYEDVIVGNTMQFCFQFNVKDQKNVEKAYHILKEDAKISHPLSETFYSPLMFSLIDMFGVNWCMFLTT